MHLSRDINRTPSQKKSGLPGTLLLPLLMRPLGWGHQPLLVSALPCGILCHWLIVGVCWESPAGGGVGFQELFSCLSHMWAVDPIHWPSDTQFGYCWPQYKPTKEEPQILTTPFGHISHKKRWPPTAQNVILWCKGRLGDVSSCLFIVKWSGWDNTMDERIIMGQHMLLDQTVHVKLDHSHAYIKVWINRTVCLCILGTLLTTMGV